MMSRYERQNLVLCYLGPYFMGDLQLIAGRGRREGLREQGKLKVNFKMSAAFIRASHVQYLKKNHIDSQFRLFWK